MATGASPWRNAAVLLVLTTLPPADAAAATWTVTPDITLRQSYTDNVLLSEPPIDDFVTVVTPGIRVEGRGARFRASLAYSPSAIFYARTSEANDVANTLNAYGSLEAIENFFFVEANGNVSQTFITPFAARPGDLTTISPNRSETRTFGISPYVRGRAGDLFTYELRNSNTWTTTDSEALRDVQTSQWSARLATPVALFGSALEYEDRTISYPDSPQRDRNSRLFRSRIFYQPDATLRLSASAGREDNDYSLQELSYAIYGAGLSWKPGPRTSAELEWEERYFGQSRLARLTHRTRLTAWTLAYSRNATDYQQEILRLPPGNTAALLDAIFAARIPDPAERQAAVERFMRASGAPAFLANPLAFYSQQIFLSERLEASVGILGQRNLVILTGFYSEDSQLPAALVAAVPDVFSLAIPVKQHGFGLRAEHRLAPFTTVAAGASRTFARQEEPSTFDTRNDYLTLDLTHRLSPKTNAFAGFSSSRFQSNGASSPDANSVFVGLYHRF